MFFVYVLRNPEGRQYSGQTDDLGKRVAQHNSPDHHLTRTTKRYRSPWLLVHHEEVASRSEALRREKWLKSGAGRAWLKDTLPSDARASGHAAPGS